MTDENKILIGDLDSRTMLYTELRQQGGDPSFLFELLEGIIERREWDDLLDEDGSPVGSFRRLIEAPMPTGVGIKADKLLALLRIEHRYEDKDSDWKGRMEYLRQTVEKLMNDELPELLPPRRPTKKEKARKGSDTTLNDDRGATYNLSRLKRDRPDLAERVIDGELSPHAAAIEAGFRAKRVAVNVNDVQSAAKTLKSYMTREQREELAFELLQD